MSGPASRSIKDREYDRSLRIYGLSAVEGRYNTTLSRRRCLAGRLAEAQD